MVSDASSRRDVIVRRMGRCGRDRGNAWFGVCCKGRGWFTNRPYGVVQFASQGRIENGEDVVGMSAGHERVVHVGLSQSLVSRICSGKQGENAYHDTEGKQEGD